MFVTIHRTASQTQITIFILFRELNSIIKLKRDFLEKMTNFLVFLFSFFLRRIHSVWKMGMLKKQVCFNISNHYFMKEAIRKNNFLNNKLQTLFKSQPFPSV